MSTAHEPARQDGRGALARVLAVGLLLAVLVVALPVLPANADITPNPPAGSTSILATETFDGGLPAGWSSDGFEFSGANNGGITPLTGPYAWWDDSDDIDDAELVTPLLDLTGATNPVLQFDVHSFRQSGYDGTATKSSIRVEVLDAGGTLLDTIFEIGDTDSNNDAGWLGQDILLSAFVDQQVQLRFTTINEAGTNHDIAVDNVRVDDWAIPSGVIDGRIALTSYIPASDLDVTLFDNQLYNEESCGRSIGPAETVIRRTAVVIGETELDVDGNPTSAQILYDHTEDGVTNSRRLDEVTDELWGDGDPSNGFPPGFPADLLFPGDTVVLSSVVDPAITDRDDGEIVGILDLTEDTTVTYSGGDRLTSASGFVMTAVAWNDSSSTLLGGAVEVLDTTKWGRAYTFPAGEDAGLVRYQVVVASIVALRDGTDVTLPDGSVVTLAQGESHLLEGIDVGDQISASAPVGVTMFTGDLCGTFESRWLSLWPDNKLANEYFTPVADNEGGGSQNDVAVDLFNPGSSPLTITIEDEGGTQTVTVPAGEVQTVRLFAADSVTAVRADSNFIALAVYDVTGSQSARDWAYALPPGDQLSPVIQAGLALGVDPTLADANPTLINSPIWLGAVWVGDAAPPASVEVCVDWNGDGGIVDPGDDAQTWDYSFTTTHLDLTTLDEGEVAATPAAGQPLNANDLSGTIAFVCSTGAPNPDLADWRLAAAWGQDASGSTGSPSLDAGTAILNLPATKMEKTAVIEDTNGNGVNDPGDRITYTLTVTNLSGVPVPRSQIKIWDNLPPELAYIPGTTTLTRPNGTVDAVPDDSAGALTLTPVDDADPTNEEFDNGGGELRDDDDDGVWWNPALQGGRSVSVTFDMVIVAGSHDTTIVNTGLSFDGVILSIDDVAIPIQELISVGNRVWLDEDGDGQQDAGEDGVANAVVTVSYTDPNTGEAVAVETITDADGGYIFTGLPILPAGGAFTIVVTPPAGMDATFDEDGGLDLTTTLVSDPLGEDPDNPFALQPGEEHETTDFGLNWVPPGNTDEGAGVGAIGDRVWSDADGDGVQDPGEPGLAGVELTLFGDPDGDGVYDTAVATTTTGPDGSYVFDDLPAGAYVVEVTTPPTGTQTGDPDDFGTIATAPDGRTTTPIVLGPGDVFTNADFGYQGATGSIGDTIWVDLDGDGVQDADEPGIPGVTVSLRDSAGNVVATTTTGADGTYSFDGVPAGDYDVVVTDTGNVVDSYVQTGDPDGTPDNATTVSLGDGQVIDTVDFGYSPDVFDVPGSAIGDTIFLDRDGDGVADPGEGLEGVVVTVTNEVGTVIATLVTDENGNYYLGGLPAGSYEIEVDASTLPPGLDNTTDPDGPPDNLATVTVDGVANNLDQDFGYQPATPNSIGGTLWEDTDADGILDPEEAERFDGVTVVLTDADGRVIATTTTAPDGSYSFDNLPDGDYVVRVTDDANVVGGYWHSDAPAPGTDGQSQDDAGYPVSVSGGATDTTADFGYYLDPSSVGNAVFDDANGDGIYDADEVGIVGATVQLDVTYPDGTVVTVVTTTSDGTTDVDGDGVIDPAGSYSFGNLLLDEDHNGVDGPQPEFSISVTELPAEYAEHLSTHPQVPEDPDVVGGGVDDNADDPAGELGFPVQGAGDPTNDFGFTLPASISGTVTEDLTGDGAGDLPLPGVTVELYADTDGDGQPDGDPIATVETDPDGSYLFEGLLPGDYVVVEVNPDGYVDVADADSTPDGDPFDDDATVDNAVPVTLTGGEHDDGNDFVDFITASIDIVKTAGDAADGEVWTANGDLGEEVTYTFAVTNDGLTTLTDVTVTDPLAGLGPITCDAGVVGAIVLLPGESTTCTATYQLAQADIDAGEVLNTATATAERLGGDPNDPADDITDEDPAEVLVPQVVGMDLAKATNGVDSDAAPGVQVASGSTVTWSYTVTNTGNVALADVAVVDDNGTPGDAADDFDAVLVSGDTDGDGLLDVDEAWVFEATGTAQVGQYGNVATTSGNPVASDGTDLPDLEDAAADDVDFYFGADDAVDIEKSTNGVDADAATGPIVEVGAEVTWTYSVTNTGNAPFDGVDVTDDQGIVPVPVDADGDGFNDGDLDLDGLLDPGETWLYEATGVAEAGQYTNVGSVDATRSDGVEGFPAGEAADSDPSNYYGGEASLLVEKSTNGVDADTAAESVLVPAGDPVTWTYAVTNDGNLPLDAPIVADDQGVAVTAVDADGNGFNDGDLDADGILDVAETWLYEATGTAPEGQYTNVGSATATPLDPTTLEPVDGLDPVTDDDPSNLFGVVTEVLVDKTTYPGHDAGAGCPGGELAQGLAGFDVTYCFEITNPATSNVTLAPVAFADADLGIDGTALTLLPASTGTLEALAPGQVVVAYYETTTSGDLVNTATVTGTPEDPNNPGTPIGSDQVPPPTAEDTAEVDEVAPALELVKTAGAAADDQVADGETYPADFESDVVHVLSVANTGDTELAEVVLTDDTCADPVFDPASDAGGDGVLSVGETWTWTCTVAAVTADYTNVADVTANPVWDDDGDPATPPVDIPGIDPADNPTATDDAVVDVVGNVVVAKADPTLVYDAAAGTYLATYLVDVTNEGAATTYDLVDALDFGDGATVVAAAIAVVAPADGTVVPDPAWNGEDATTVVTAQAIDAAATHTFEVVVTLTLDPAVVTPGSADCDPNTGTGGTGLRNVATVTSEGAEASDDGCVPFPVPDLAITKSVVDGPTVDGVGAYTISYEVVVTNAGEGPGTYDLDDALAFGAGVSIDSATISAADADTPAPNAGWDGVAATTVQAGAPIVGLGTHTYAVTASGSIAGIESGTAADCALAPGEDGTGFLNTATLSVDEQDTPATACEPVPIEGALTLVKTAGASADDQVPDGEPHTDVDVDDVVTYVFTVTNTGPVTLDELVIDDPLEGLSAVTCAATTLLPGQVTTCEATLTITQDHVDAGEVLNTATATALDPAGTEATDTDPAVVQALRAPELTLEKVADPVTYAELGELITYTYTLTNSGNLTLVAPFEVADDRIPNAVDGPVTCPADATGVGNGDAWLQPDESIDCTGSYTITQEDLDAGEVVNTATATASDPNGTPDDPNDDTPVTSNEDTATVTSEATPLVEIVKTAGASADDQTADGEPYTGVVLDDVVTYVFVVTNSGVLRIDDVTVTDPLEGLSAVTCGDPDANGTASLLPGETLTCEATYTITQDDVNAGEVLNEATASAVGSDGTPVEEVDDAVVQPEQSPELSLDKTVYDGHDAGAGAPGAELVLGLNGAPVTYVFTVVNSGTVEIQDVVIADADLGIDVADLTLLSGDPASLGVGETVVWFYEGVIDGDLLNTASATGETPTGDPDDPADDVTTQDTAEVDEVAPALELVKTAGTAVDDQVADGETHPADYESDVVHVLTVTNTGDTDLAEVVLSDDTCSDPVFDDSTDLGGDGVLSVGESWTWTCTVAAVTADYTNVADVTANPVWDDDADPATPPVDIAGIDPADNPTGTDDAVVDVLGEVVVDKGDPDIAYDPATQVYTLTYVVTAQNVGADTTYSLVDEVAFGDAATVTGGTVTVLAPDDGTITPSDTWDGLGDTTVVADQPIAVGITHTYQVVVTATIDAAAVTPEDGDCDPANGPAGTGFLNTATITSDGPTSTDDGCEPFPDAAYELTKEVTSGPTSNGDGTYDLTYTITVVNTGDGPGGYDLDDEFTFGDGITVVSAAVANTLPGDIPTNVDFDGEAITQIATDVPIAGGATHAYEVTVTADALAVSSPTAADCDLADGEDGTGFRNEATLSDGPTSLDADDCAEVPLPNLTITKTVVGSVVADDGDTFTTTYEVQVANAGDAGPGSYTLVDELRFPAGASVVTSTIVAADADSPTPEAGWNGIDATTVIGTPTPLAPGSAHTFTVSVTSDIDPTMTSTERDCDLTAGEDATGFTNAATLSVFGQDAEADACAEIPGPNLSITKTVTSPATVDDAGNFTGHTYEIVVTNAGDGPGTYDLTDTLRFGEGITVSDATMTDPDGVVVTGWDGIGSTVAVDDRPIVGATSETFTVVVNGSVAGLVGEEAGDCELAPGEDGTGFLNEALLTWELGESEDDACGEEPDPAFTITKDATGVTTQADGTQVVTYDVVVRNTAGSGTYDLTDELRYGDGIVVVAATVSDSPAAVTPNAAWDGQADTSLASGVFLAGGGTHVYTISVVADATASTTTTSRDCTLDPGEEGTGFLNEATVDSEVGTEAAEDCEEVPLPDLSITKEVTSGPTSNGDGTYDLTYDVVVANAGDGPDRYNLVDEFTFGDGITVVGTPTADVASTTATNVPTADAGWDGVGATTLAADQPIVGNTAHTYTISVTADALEITSLDAGDCVLGDDETGTGFRNQAGLEPTISEADEADDCAEVPEPLLTITKTVTDGPTSVDADTTSITYEIAITNAGDGPGTYAVIDDLAFGDGITPATVDVTATDPVDLAVSATFDGQGDTTLVASQPIAPLATHTIEVTVTADIDPATTSTARDCEVTDGEVGTGLLNGVELEVFGDPVDQDDACGEVPAADLSLDKVANPVTIVDGDTVEITYDLTVVNAGDGIGSYDLADTLQFGAGITIDEVTASSDDAILVAGFNGQDATALVEGQAIDPGSSQVITITVVATVAADTAVDARDCELGAGEEGTGLLNGATMTFDATDSDADACQPVPEPDITILKTVTDGPTQVDGFTYTVAWDLVVTNEGAGAGTYDLVDTFEFADGITVEDVAVTAPIGEVASATFDGAADPTVATGANLAGGASETWSVVATVTIDPSLGDTARDCALDPGEDGTALRNSGSVSTPFGDDQSDDCVEVPAGLLAITKDAGDLVDLGDNAYALDYVITVGNDGDGPMLYTLTDTFAFADGLVVTSVAVVNDVPGDVELNVGFDGAGDPLVAADVAVAAGDTHSYTVSVEVDATGVHDESLFDCDVTDGETGTGLLNRAEVNPAAEDCVELPRVIDLELAKEASTETVRVGDMFTWTLTVTNNGPAGATGVTVLDQLPDSVEFVSSDGDYDFQTGVWTIGDIPFDGTATLQITVLAVAAGDQLNTAEVASADQPDSDSEPGNGDPDEDDQDSSSVTVDAVPVPPPPPPPPPPLPVTGVPLPTLASLALALLFAGFVLHRVGRRRTAS